MHTSRKGANIRQPLGLTPNQSPMVSSSVNIASQRRIYHQSQIFTCFQKIKI